MKIGIVGGGNGGLVVALFLLRHVYNQDVEVEVYYDPKIPIEKVGQGSLVNFVSLIYEILGIDWYNNEIGATFKSGILYEGWGKKKDKFFHAFPMDYMAVHYSPDKLRECMIAKNVCKFIEKNVEDCNELDCDYVFDCRGTPKDFSDYNTLKNPLNSVILGNEEYVDLNQHWTRCIATPDGWMFGIPRKDRTNYGYLFNSSYTSEEEARRYMEEELCIKTTEVLHFKNYLSKNPIQNDKVILNGNRLLFIEPLEASSVESYYRWTNLVCQWIFGGRPKTDILQELVADIEEVQNFILWHYFNGSRYNTKFWSEAEKMSKSHSYGDKFSAFVSDAKSKSRIELIYDNTPTYGHWYTTSLRNWIDGTEELG